MNLNRRFDPVVDNPTVCKIQYHQDGILNWRMLESQRFSVLNHVVGEQPSKAPRLEAITLSEWKMR